MKLLLKSLTLFVLIFALTKAEAQRNGQPNLVERIFEGYSKNENQLLAKGEITAEASERVSEALIKEIIGENKYNRNKALIFNKVVKNSARYIPFSRPGEVKAAPEGGFRMAVTLKVSVDDLQGLLLENGLFYESDGMPTVLPTVRWTDKSNGKVFRWWMDAEDQSRSFLSQQNRNLENALRLAFAKNQFYVQRPGLFRYHQVLGEAFKVDRLSPDDLQIIGQKLGVQIVIEGEVHIVKSSERADAQKIEIKMSALQVMNGRAIAEVSRQFETDSGAFDGVVDRKLKEILDSTTQDLAGQVFDAWSRGAIGASLYRLTIKGKLPLNQQEVFKETLKSKLREIKDIKERIISSDEIVFEVDSTISPKDIGVKIKEFEIPGYKFTLLTSGESDLSYRLQRN
jgi:hypothetical protein